MVLHGGRWLDCGGFDFLRAFLCGVHSFLLMGSGSFVRYRDSQAD